MDQLQLQGITPIEKTTQPKKKKGVSLPENLNKAVSSRVPDFNDPQRRPTCLEIDFPIAPINRLAQQEGNAGKPIYQMSKWWARRRSSVFRSMLLAAATEAPADDQTKQIFTAAKQIWESYYANHQKAGSFRNLTILDPFMGGGTTLVEGARLGMQMRGQDLNPVAWFVVKNELSDSDSKQVADLFGAIESSVKPQIQPFYVTSCPRGHQGYWHDADGKVYAGNPLDLAPEQRQGLRWRGPEVIYTFWAKHSPCSAHEEMGGYRTPVFRSSLIAQKSLKATYLSLTCPNCHDVFDAELGETRMAPGSVRIVIPGGRQFTEITQSFAQLVKNYDTGSRMERQERIQTLLQRSATEPGLRCPSCQTFAGHALEQTLRSHMQKILSDISKVSKKNLEIQSKEIRMLLFIHPAWLQGAPGKEDGQSYGGYVGADPQDSAAWYQRRLRDTALVEIRLPEQQTPVGVETEYNIGSESGESEQKTDTETTPNAFGIPDQIMLPDGAVLNTKQGTVPKQSTCTCAACGRQNDVSTSIKTSEHSAPVAVYALQCFCPECAAAEFNYNGRYFKAPDADDIARINATEYIWAQYKETKLNDYWPREVLPYAHMTYELNGGQGGLPSLGYTHWWTMFNPRQLLVHAQLLRAITEADPARWPLNVRMQVLGAFQQYLRNQNMFCFWDLGYDKLVPHMSNNNYHPKALVVENSVFTELGRGTWNSTKESVVEGLQWKQTPWEAYLPDGAKQASHLSMDDSLDGNKHIIYNGSSTELPMADASVDLVITDPPFGDNVFYADLADFFYAWLRIPLARWYAGQPEAAYFAMPATPKALEAITNKAEHPDTRTKEELEQSIPAPADQFYQNALTMCWQEAYRVLKPGGLLAFTFHHSQDEPWINVLESLFAAQFILVASYPIRSDESKGSKGQFGSKKIEYDIIHVCRKRLEDPDQVSWPRMRRWVKDEVETLRRMLETYHKEDLSEPDIQVILRGKALEFYSRHYGCVVNSSGQSLTIHEALIGINTLIDELREQNTNHPPDSADLQTYRFLSIFGAQGELQRDDLHKLLRGAAIDPSYFLKAGWLREKPTKIYEVVPIVERFQKLRMSGRNHITSDLDQVHFLIGAAIPGSGYKLTDELGKLSLADSVESLLSWYADNIQDGNVRNAASVAHRAVVLWRIEKEENHEMQGKLF